MKKTFCLFLFAWLIAIPATFACEICGCGNNNFQIGMLPYYKKAFLGFRYTTSQYHSSVSDAPGEFSHDYYKTTEVWGGYSTGKFQLMGFVPYFISKKVSDDGITNSGGMGDVMLLVNYRVLNAANLSSNERISIRNELFVGAGIKLPTGVNQVDTSNPDFNIGDFNSQAGTGSVDYLINATHNLMWNNSGIITNAAYRFNTSNPQQYRFGNRAYVNMAYYYSITVWKTKIKPNVGFSFQSNAINTYKGDQVADSNGYNFNAAAGVNLVLDKIGINALASVPVAQNMYAGQTKMSSRIALGLTYSF